jgi:hypothetical protein
MYKTISNKIIRKFNIGYDPSKFITDENEELPIKEWVQKYRKVVPAKNILWLLLREEFLSKKKLILFGVWCARELLKSIENPDERDIEYCNVVERYANGKATQADIWNASADVLNVSNGVYITFSPYFNAAHYASARAVCYAAHSAANASLAVFSVSDTVSDADVAAADAAYYTIYDAISSVQLDKLLTYFK